MRRLGLSATLLALGTVLATAQSYRVRELKPLPNHVGSVALGVAENGDASGYSVAANGSHRATLWRQGQAIDVGNIQGFESSEAVGQTSTGDYAVCSTQSHAPITAIRYNGEMRIYPETRIYDVSETGYFAGDGSMEPGWIEYSSPRLMHGHQAIPVWFYATGDRHTILGVSDVGEPVGMWVPSFPTSTSVGLYYWNLQPNGSGGSALYDRNDVGFAVGQSSNLDTGVIVSGDFGQNHNFLGRLDGYAFQSAMSINNSNRIVGKAWKSNGEAEALLWASFFSVSRLVDHVQNPEGWVLAEATRLSHSGFIVGTGTWNGLQLGYVAAPVPEPATPLIFGFGLVAGARCKRRNQGRAA